MGSMKNHSILSQRACIGGIFLSIQKMVKNLRTTTTEIHKHILGQQGVGVESSQFTSSSYMQTSWRS